VDECYPHRDAVNECFRNVNTEENYQKFRLAFLRGELLQMHAERLVSKVETYKARVPDSMPNWKADYAWRLTQVSERLPQDASPLATEVGPHGGITNVVSGLAPQQAEQRPQPHPAGRNAYAPQSTLGAYATEAEIRDHEERVEMMRQQRPRGGGLAF
jgi:hypothetical protein